MKRIHIFCAALMVLALFASCSEEAKEQQESKPECYIHYTADTLDEQTTKAIAALGTTVNLPRTQQQVDSAISVIKGFTYEQYSATHPGFSEGTTVDSLVDENGYITLKITRPSTEEGAKLPEGNLIYIHGGGFLFATSKIHCKFCEALAERMNCTVYMALYPLAPNYYVQTSLDMLLGVYRTIRKEDKPLYVMGDSAGANLVLTFGLYLKGINEQLPDALFPISPFCDFTLSDPEWDEYNKKDAVLSAYLIQKVSEQWHPADMDTKDPLVSPLFGDWKGMCQTFLFAGTDETFYPEIMKLHQNMEDSGVRVGTLVGKKLFHVAPIMLPWLADRYIDESIEFLYGAK